MTIRADFAFACLWLRGHAQELPLEISKLCRLRSCILPSPLQRGTHITTPNPHPSLCPFLCQPLVICRNLLRQCWPRQETWALPCRQIAPNCRMHPPPLTAENATHPTTPPPPRRKAALGTKEKYSLTLSRDREDSIYLSASTSQLLPVKKSPQGVSDGIGEAHWANSNTQKSSRDCEITKAAEGPSRWHHLQVHITSWRRELDSDSKKPRPSPESLTKLPAPPHEQRNGSQHLCKMPWLNFGNQMNKSLQS